MTEPDDKDDAGVVRVGDYVEHEKHGLVRIADIKIKAEAVGPNGAIQKVGVEFISGLESGFFGGEVAFWSDFKEGIIEVKNND